jgi:hypothetical protein
VDLRLTDEEIRLLKELKGAGDRGRQLPQARLALARLLRTGYVKHHLRITNRDQYVITAIGAIALSNANT